MSHARYAKKIDVNQPAIVEALRKMGASVEHIARPVDLVVGYAGITRLVEIKNPEHYGKLSPGQKKFIDEWRGGRVPVVRTVEEARAVLDEMKIEARAE